jgi:putative intracellular protease/amidase
MDKTILAVVSNFGYWGIELAGPRAQLVQAGYSLAYCTPRGQRPIALPPSYDPDFIDPPLGARVNRAEDVELTRRLMDSPELDDPIDLSRWYPRRPYVSQEQVLRAWEEYQRTLLERRQELARYAGLLLVGGSGPILDMVNNQRLHDLILGFHQLGKPIAAICYGVACLPMARDFHERASLLRGKHVTGHCIEFDYLEGTGFVGTELDMGPPPYCLEYLLRDAVRPGGRFHGNFGKPTSVIVDYPFITARSLQCSHEFGEQFVQVLEKGLTRYGW